MVAAPFYALETPRTVLPAWRDFMATAPDEVSSLALFWSVPADEPFPPEPTGSPSSSPRVYAGPVEEGERAMQPLRELAEPLLDLSGPWPWVDLQAASIPSSPRACSTTGSRARSGSCRRRRSTSSRTSRRAAVAADGHRGLAPRRRDEPGRRDGDRVWRPRHRLPGQRRGDLERSRADRRGDRLGAGRVGRAGPHSTGGLYPNFAGFGEEKEELARGAYGANYERLTTSRPGTTPRTSSA